MDLCVSQSQKWYAMRRGVFFGSFRRARVLRRCWLLTFLKCNSAELKLEIDYRLAISKHWRLLFFSIFDTCRWCYRKPVSNHLWLLHLPSYQGIINANFADCSLTTKKLFWGICRVTCWSINARIAISAAKIFSSWTVTHASLRLPKPFHVANMIVSTQMVRLLHRCLCFLYRQLLVFFLCKFTFSSRISLR